MESIALKRGLPPEGFDVLLDVALSGKLGKMFVYCWHVFSACLFPLPEPA